MTFFRRPLLSPIDSCSDVLGKDGNEVNGDAINLENDGQFDGKRETITDKQQLKSQQTEKNSTNFDDDKELSMNQQNGWDVKFCHKNIELTDANCLTVHRKGNEKACWCSVFAKHSILKTLADSGNFYFEIGVEKSQYTYGLLFGIAVKTPLQLGENIRNRRDTYAYQCNGQFWINGALKDGNVGYYAGDVVGCGVNLATRQIIFTKNGHRLGTSDLAISSSFSAGQVFPFVSLLSFGDEIETNFGPNFFLANI